MESNVYQKEAMRTLNPKLNPQEVLVNSVMGLCGESGEAVDLVKKHLFQGHPLDEEHLKKELGDIAWYLAEACTALNVNLDEVLQGNLDKLAKRYPDGFSTADSEKRKPGDL
jgi:NTP pyrophosphatase (non-canonical NTP hydrolase)